MKRGGKLLRRTPLGAKAGKVAGRKALIRGRAKPLNRRSLLKAKGGSRFPRRRNAAYRKWVATLPCIVGGCRNFPSECTHVRSKGAGGDDIGNCLPLCRSHHQEQHRIGIISFSDRYRLNLSYRAEMLARLYKPKEEVF